MKIFEYIRTPDGHRKLYFLNKKILSFRVPCKFRKLYADEIECRIGTISEKGLSLLLYKDARVDMSLLDETVGPMNWKREHTRENRNCIVSIYDEDKREWISKEDTGTESNNEAEKGLASDSFKRACVNWGIGRELYTAPFIYIPASKVEITPKGNKYTTYDKFHVEAIKYDKNRNIIALSIKNQNNKRVYLLEPPKEVKKEVKKDENNKQ